MFRTFPEGPRKLIKAFTGGIGVIMKRKHFCIVCIGGRRVRKEIHVTLYVEGISKRFELKFQLD